MSEEALDSLQTTLLIFSVLVFGWILYRRLLDAMGRKSVLPPSIGLDEVHYHRDSGMLEATAVLPEKDAMIFSLVSAHDGSRIELLKDERSGGRHLVSFTLKELAPGRYELVLESRQNKVSRFFEVA
ncbi:MAG: hypothetical protein JNM00_10845 [Flavobacteriales bacterium]|nr:hypothetical protein [Flavobacteriales bacterium]